MDSWREVLEAANTKASKCKCCLLCNGKACRGETPGVGGKGSGEGFVRNYEKLKEVLLVLDTITSNEEIDTSTNFFGHQVSIPVYAAPISGIQQNYGADLSDGAYSKMLVEGCIKANTIAFTGDGMHDAMFLDPLSEIEKFNGIGVPTIKPWNHADFLWRMEAAKKANVLAIATDIDASGLTNLRNSITPVGFKDVASLKELKEKVNCPFIIKGILSVKGALKAKEAGADAIIISNHGGRVLDECVSTIEVLPEIAQALKGSNIKILIDGGFRTGLDVFKALALGADGVLIGRPFSLAVIGDGANGVKLFLEKIALELKETMAMCGVKKISEINQEHVRVAFTHHII